MSRATSIRGALIRLFCAVGLLGMHAVSVAGQSGTYTWTDERGVVHFSNSLVPRKHMAGAELRADVVVPTPGWRPRTSATIPLISRDQKRFVKARLEGASATREVMMLVDTGAQITMVDQSTAEELGVQFVEEAGIAGVTGVAPGWIGELRRVQLGDKEVRDWRIMVGPMPGVLLLGMDVLEHLKLSVASDHLEAQ
jgi:predicted aspartyl protease